MAFFEKSIEGYPGYLVFFDNLRVDQYVQSFRTSISVNGSIGQATLEMLYIPEFYQVEITNDQGQTSIVDGIENMTSVRIFSKNMFNGRYVQIFEGNLRGKNRTRSSTGYSLTFTATDYMPWLNRTIVPLAIPFEATYKNQLDLLRWRAQGIDTDLVNTLTSNLELSFKGKNVREYVAQLLERTLKNNKLFSDPNSVAAWDNPTSRVYVMGDINPELVQEEVVDFLLVTTATSLNSLYVAFNDIARNLMFEFYQDRDGMIRIKPPFWNEKILRDHVIDPQMILSINEDTDYSNFYTRVCVSGSMEEYEKTASNDLAGMLTPGVVYVGDTSDDAAGYFATSQDAGTMIYNGGDNREGDAKIGELMSVPGGDTSFKSWMPYTAITSVRSVQYQMQQKARTGAYGIRMIGGDYMVAMGSFYGPLETRYRITLDTGKTFTVIKSEAKADIHTDANNQVAGDGSVIEFIIDPSQIDSRAKRDGTFNSIPDFQGNIASIMVLGKDKGDVNRESVLGKKG